MRYKLKSRGLFRFGSDQFGFIRDVSVTMDGDRLTFSGKKSWWFVTQGLFAFGMAIISVVILDRIGVCYADPINILILFILFALVAQRICVYNGSFEIQRPSLTDLTRDGARVRFKGEHRISHRIKEFVIELDSVDTAIRFASELQRTQSGSPLNIIESLGSTRTSLLTSARTLIFRIGAIILCLYFVAGIVFLRMMFGRNESYQTGLSSYTGLPPTASDITIFMNRNITGTVIADFKITENDFVAYAKEKSWSLQPITAPKKIRHAQAYHEGRFAEHKEITDGLYYERREADGGGTTLMYDRATSRAYIYETAR